MLALGRTRELLRGAIAEGREVGTQLHVVRGAESSGLALGSARVDARMGDDSIVLWFSSVKPLMGVAIGQLVERGLVGFDDPVAQHLPEFAQNGKERVTLRHLLTHTACMPNAHRTWSLETWDEIVAKICAAALEPDWVLGRDSAYHVASAWYVLGEIVRRRDGRPYPRYVREAILGPLGIDELWVGMPAEDYAANQERIAQLHDERDGSLLATPFWAWDGSREALALCRPGGSGWGTSQALARFYAMLLGGGELDGVRILESDTVACLIAPAVVGAHDRVFATRLDRGLGFVLDSKAYGLSSAWYGTRCSSRTFGHGGYFSSVAFADPAHDLAVALAWNTVIEPKKHDQRLRETLDALYEDLGC